MFLFLCSYALMFLWLIFLPPHLSFSFKLKYFIIISLQIDDIIHLFESFSTTSKNFCFVPKIYLSIFVKQLIHFFQTSDWQILVTGWGVTESGLHQHLLQANLPLVTNTQCKEIFRNRTGKQIWYKQVCAGGERNVDPCAGDSGGPLQAVGRYNGTSMRMIQHGVISYGLSACGTKGVPGVYTRVSYYMDWILDTMTD